MYVVNTRRLKDLELKDVQEDLKNTTYSKSHPRLVCWATTGKFSQRTRVTLDTVIIHVTLQIFFILIEYS